MEIPKLHFNLSFLQNQLTTLMQFKIIHSRRQWKTFYRSCLGLQKMDLLYNNLHFKDHTQIEAKGPKSCQTCMIYTKQWSQSACHLKIEFRNTYLKMSKTILRDILTEFLLLTYLLNSLKVMDRRIC